MANEQAGQKRQAEVTRVDEAITTLIEDLHSRGQLSDEQLKGVAGGYEVTVCQKVGDNVIHMTSYAPVSSTADNDNDYSAAD